MANITEQEWNKLKINARREIGWCDIKEYSHNIIALCMMNMNEEEMKRFAGELELGRLGWDHLDDETHELSVEDKRANAVAYKLREARMKN